MNDDVLELIDVMETQFEGDDPDIDIYMEDVCV